MSLLFLFVGVSLALNRHISFKHHTSAVLKVQKRFSEIKAYKNIFQTSKSFSHGLHSAAYSLQSTECDTLYNGVVTYIAANNCTDYGVLLSETANATDLTTRLTEFCPLCGQPLLTLLSSASQVCSNSSGNQEQLSFLQLAYGLHDSFCYRLNNEYCYASQATLRTLGDMSNITDATLDTICSACTMGYLERALSIVNDPDTALNFLYFDAICLKDNGSYCFPKFAKISDELEAGKLDTVCGPCSYQLLGRVLFVSQQKYAADPNDTDSFEEIQSMNQTLSLLPLYCQKNPSGQFCATLFFNINTSKVDDVCNSSTATSCSAACSTEIRNLVNNELKCCASIPLDIEKATCDPSGNESCGEISAQFKACGINPPTSCAAGQGTVETKITMTNINAAWCKSNMTACQDYVKSFVAVMSSTSPDQIVSISIDTDTGKKDTIVVTIVTKPSVIGIAGNLNNTAVPALVPGTNAIKLDPLQPVKLTTTPSSKTGAAAALLPSCLTVLAIVSLFFQF